MKPEIEIKKVTIEELQVLQDISRQTFSETFSATNTEADMQQYLDESFSAGKLAAELSNPDSEFFFAWAGGSVIGYIKLNFDSAQTEIKDSRGMEIERIYVGRKFQGMHAGQVLFKKSLERAKDSKLAYIWLGVWEKNERAIAFYKKNGFRVFGTHLFRLGQDEQTDLMMKLQLAD